MDEPSKASSGCSSTRTAHAGDTPARPRTSVHSEASRYTGSALPELPAGTEGSAEGRNIQPMQPQRTNVNVFPVRCERTRSQTPNQAEFFAPETVDEGLGVGEGGFAGVDPSTHVGRRQEHTPVSSAEYTPLTQAYNLWEFRAS